jgi:hypothetical protein
MGAAAATALVTVALLALSAARPVRADGHPIQTCDQQRPCLKWNVKSIGTCAWQVRRRGRGIFFSPFFFLRGEGGRRTAGGASVPGGRAARQTGGRAGSDSDVTLLPTACRPRADAHQHCPSFPPFPAPSAPATPLAASQVCIHWRPGGACQAQPDDAVDRVCVRASQAVRWNSTGNVKPQPESTCNYQVGGHGGAAGWGRAARGVDG